MKSEIFVVPRRAYHYHFTAVDDKKRVFDQKRKHYFWFCRGEMATLEEKMEDVKISGDKKPAKNKKEGKPKKEKSNAAKSGNPLEVLKQFRTVCFLKKITCLFYLCLIYGLKIKLTRIHNEVV